LFDIHIIFHLLAGGFDALYAILLSSSSQKDVESLWTNWQEMKVLPLILSEEARGVCIETNFHFSKDEN
jgi:hypothetical protein